MWKKNLGAGRKRMRLVTRLNLVQEWLARSSGTSSRPQNISTAFAHAIEPYMRTKAIHQPPAMKHDILCATTQSLAVPREQ